MYSSFLNKYVIVTSFSLSLPRHFYHLKSVKGEFFPLTFQKIKMSPRTYNQTNISYNEPLNYQQYNEIRDGERSMRKTKWRIEFSIHAHCLQVQIYNQVFNRKALTMFLSCNPVLHTHMVLHRDGYRIS